MKWLFRFLSVCSFLFLLRAGFEQWDKIKTLLSIDLLPMFCFVTLSFVINTVIGAEVWYQLLNRRDLSRRWHWSTYMRTQIAKYLPGNIGVFIGRALVAERAGVSKRSTVVSIVQEHLYVVASVSILSVLLFPLCSELLHLKTKAFAIPSWSYSLLAVFGLFFLFNFHRFSNFLRGKGFEKFPIVEKVPFVVFFHVLFLQSSQFFILGFSAFFLLQMLHPLYLSNPLNVVVANAISQMAGLLVPGAPAGIGVREFVFVQSLKEAVPQDVLLTLAALMRAAAIVGDLSCLALGQLLRHKSE